MLTPYHVSGKEVNGKQTVTYDEGKILWNGRQYDELVFEPLQESVAAFELLDVTIGINFHWERKEDQRFQGSLKIIVENGKLTGINVIRVEDYLTSVISSEMSATASLELLKAHAVISRSWLLANLSGLQINNSQLSTGNDTMRNKNANQDNAANCQPSTADCQLKWYERDLRKTERCYVLADSQKFGMVSSVTFGVFEEATILTETEPPEGFSGSKNIRVAK